MRVSFRSLVMMVVASVALAGCGESFLAKKMAPRLAGERIDVTLQPTLLQPTPGAEQEPFELPAAAASANWSQVGGNAAHYAAHLDLPAGVVRAWSERLGGGANAGDGKILLNPPVVNAGRLFAMTTGAKVYALDAKTGKELWSKTLKLKEKEQAGLSGGLAVMGDLLFVTTGSGQVFALTASTGKPVWDVNLGVPLRAAPTVVGEKVLVVSHDNRLFTLSALDGGLLWTHSGLTERLSLVQGAAPAADHGLVAVAYNSGEVYVLRESDGRYAWHESLSSPFSGLDPENTISGITAAPVIADGLLYVVGNNGGLAAYGLTNGQRYWRSDVMTTQMPWVAGLQMFVLTDKGELVAMNRKDGAVRWVSDLGAKLPEKSDRLWAGPVLAGGRLVVTSSDGYAVSVNPKDGSRLAATELGDGVSLPPLVADGALYFMTDGGKVICFRPLTK